MRARLLRALARSAQALGLGATFVASATAAVALHADLAPGRRLLGAAAQRALGGVFEGTLALGQVERLAVSARAARVRVARVDVLDRDGGAAISAFGVEATVDVATLVRSLASGAPDVVVDDARIEGAVVVLDRDGDAGLRLAHAFRRRAPTASAPARATTSEPPRVRVRGARVLHAWVRGDVVAPMLDADVEDVRASVAVEQGVVSIALDRASMVVRSPSLPILALPPAGELRGKLTVPLATTDLAGEASFTGETAGLPFVANAKLQGLRVDAKLEVPRASPEALARAVPILRLRDPGDLVVKATGTWPSLAVDARASLGAAEVTALADVDVRGSVTATGMITAKDLDLGAFGGPPSRIAGSLSGTAALQGGTAFGTFRLATEESEIAGERIPKIAADARFEDRTLAVSARAEEPGIRAVGNAVLDVPTRALTFDVQARASDLRAVPRLRRAASGSASARATGKIDLAEATVAGAVTATADGLEDGTARVGSARGTAYVSGPLRSPVADATVDADDVRFAAGGKAPLAYPKVTARARVRLPSFALEGVDVRARTSERESARPLAIRADRVAFGREGVVLEGASVEGPFGSLAVSARTTRGGLEVRAKGEGLELHRAAAATGIAALRELPRGTRADVDVDLAWREGRADGHLDLRVKDAHGLDAAVDLALVRGHAKGTARFGLAPFGEIRARDVDVEVPGSFDAKTLARATGAIELEGDLDLAHLAPLVPRGDVIATSGTAHFTARIERPTETEDPSVRATVVTSGLSVTRATVDETGHPREEKIAGVDVSAHASFGGGTEEGEASFLAWDGAGLLASADAKARIPLGGWLRGTTRFSAEALADLEVELRADLPRRELRSLPAWLLPPRLDGVATATVSSTGPLGHPKVAALLRGSRLRERERGRGRAAAASYGPVDAEVDVRWDGEDVVAVISADERELPRGERRAPGERPARGGTPAPPRGLGAARGLVLARASSRRLVTTGRDPLFRASGELSVDRLDLSPLPLPYAPRGLVSGRFSARDVNGAPSFDVTAHVSDLVLSNARIGSGDVAIGGRDGALFGVARLEQQEGGRAQLQIVSRALHLQGSEVAWEEEASTRIDYALQGVRLSILRPIVRRLFPEIDGRVDGRGSVTLAGADQTFEGGAAISEGRVYVNLLGEEITNLGAVLYFEPNGVFRVQDATGRIGEGDLRASMTGRMKGLHFQAANATIVVPSKRGIPLSTEGATYAEATGQADVRVVMSDDRSTLLCAVDVPSARIQLPDRRTQQLQSADEDPTILVGKREANGALTKLQLRQRGARGAGGARAATNAEDQALVSRFTVSIGRDVIASGRGMRLATTGLVLVEVNDDLGVTGRIDLTEGTVDVQGRRFTVDRGTLTFVEGERPDNPTLLASAYWDAPEGTRVWAEFADPIATGKLSLRSEPPYSYNEILSLLLFGRPEGNLDGTSSGGVAGNVVAPGLNRALDELSGGELEVKANVGTTRFQQQTRPEVNVRRGRLGLTLGYVVGTISPIQPDRKLVTFDWQFLPRWSVAATYGDANTTILDVLYRYRF